MQPNPATTATLVFTQDRFVSLAKITEILSTALLRVREVVAAIEQGDSSVTVTCDRFKTKVEVIYHDRETKLAVCVADLADGAETLRDTKRAHLAFLLFPLALNLPATYLLWPSSDVQIPRLRFIEGLADSFSPYRGATDVKAQNRPQRRPRDQRQNQRNEEDALKSVLRTASGSLQNRPAVPTAHSGLHLPEPPKTMMARLAKAARPVLSSLH